MLQMRMSQMRKLSIGFQNNFTTMEHHITSYVNLMTNCCCEHLHFASFLHGMQNMTGSVGVASGNMRTVKWSCPHSSAGPGLQLVDLIRACADLASVLRVARHCQYTSDHDQGNMLHSRVTTFVTWAVCDNYTLQRDIVMTSWLSSSNIADNYGKM